MNNISTGFGLALLAGAILAYPFVSSLAPNANASAVTAAASAVSTAATGQAGPTVVWMAATDTQMFRLWSDGRLEYRRLYYMYVGAAPCGSSHDFRVCGSSDWIEVPPPPAGNGFACRADLDGNRTVDGADLGMILTNWGQQPPCEPEATFPCMTIPGGTLAPLVP
jgi:hypothetical protein